MAPLSVLLLPLTFALVFADVAYYVPKAFYTIDKFGHESAPVMLLGGPRFRRNAFGSSASSSSSSSSSGYGPGQSYSVSSSSSGNGYDPYVSSGAAYQPGYSNNYNSPGTFQSTPVIYSRFGDDVSGVGVSGVSTGGNGIYSSSSAIQDSNGQVYYTANTGKF